MYSLSLSLSLDDVCIFLLRSLGVTLLIYSEAKVDTWD